VVCQSDREGDRVQVRAAAEGAQVETITRSTVAGKHVPSPRAGNRRGAKSGKEKEYWGLKMGGEARN